MHLLSFFQSPTLLFATLVVKNSTTGYLSGIVLFIIYSNLAVNDWNKSAFTASNNSASSFTSYKWYAHGEVTLKLQISLNWITVSSIWCFIISSTFLWFLIFIVMPNKSCVSHLLIIRSPKWLLISSRIPVTKFVSTCNSLL